MATKTDKDVDTVTVTLDGDKMDKIVERALEIFKLQPEWTYFFREIFGREGIIIRTFPSPIERETFARTQIYNRLQLLLKDLRGLTEPQMKDPEPQPTKVVTVRIPACLHAALRTESYEQRTSVNKLCISKLLQCVPHRFIVPDRFVE